MQDHNRAEIIRCMLSIPQSRHGAAVEAWQTHYALVRQKCVEKGLQDEYLQMMDEIAAEINATMRTFGH